jgi:OmcA/MtrC family decaheme c-type cytochrome
MNRFSHWFKWSWTFLVAITLSFGLSGCDGKDGATGAPGPTGSDGIDGQNCWDLNENGIRDPEEDLNGDGVVDVLDCGGDTIGASVTPLESCGVCHSEGSFASAPAAHAKITEPAEVDVASFADFAVAPDVAVPADLVISFSVTVDGAPATDALFARAYFSDGTTRTSLTDRVTGDPGDPDAVPPEPPTPISAYFVNNGDGTYSLTIEGGVAEFGGTNGRYLVVVEAGSNELEIAAVGDYPAPIPLAGLASNEACVGCHGASGEVGRFNPTNRGGHYSAPMSVDACVVCHRPDNPATPDDEEPSYMRIARVVHGIHNSHDFPDGEFITDRDNVYNITYPTYMTNCSVCHSADTIVPAVGVSALAAANAMPVSGSGCFTCHGSMASWDFTGGLEFHLTLPDPETADCQVCHDAGGVAAGKVVVSDFHNGLTTERGGIVFNGVDTSVTEGAKFVWEITGVVDDGTNLAISWQASYDGVGVDPCNATAGAGAPVFHADGNGNLSMLRNYAQGDDFILGQSTSAPGQALNVGVSTDNTTCASGVATTTIPVDDVDAERGIVALQGKPRVVSVLDPTATMSVRAVTPTYEWLVGSGDAPLMTRRNVVDTGECLTCHVGSLYQHGGNRVDNIDMCILCHNSASNEKNVRVGMGVESSEAYDGKTGETYEMKTMLHRVHSAGVEGQPPYVIYRNRGIYAFAPDESLLPNWPGTGPQIVFGSNDVVQNHNYHSADYPRALNACTACHTEDFAVLPDQTLAMATTVEAGSDVWEDQLDDTLQGATTTACVTCHADSASKGHAYQNSWNPQVFPEGRQTIIDAVR